MPARTRLAGLKSLLRTASKARQAFELRSIGTSLTERNYRLFFSGQLISMAGTWMQTVALAFLVPHLTGSGTALGLATILIATGTI